MNVVSERKLVLTYGLALGVIALLSLASHVTLDQIIRQQKGSAAVVNVAGRQRMLSQRIASLAAQSVLGDRSARADLLDSIGEFERAHQALLTGDQALHLPPARTDPALQVIYFGGSHPLDGEVAAYIAHARRVADMSARDAAFGSETAALYRAARVGLLHDLNAVVTVHEAESERQLALLDQMQTAMLVVVLATLAYEAVGIFRPMVRRIMHATHELVRLASTDPLTGLLNRRSFFERGAIEFARARRYNRALTVLIVDGDHFKRVNDVFGHAGGDAVLTALAATLSQGLRTSDVLGRIGGEEFAILLPETGIEDAEFLANRLRSAIGDLRVLTKTGIAKITISVGVAGLDADTLDLGPLFARADEALYAAKEHGRNRVVAVKTA